jgi:hypothetical protein
MISKLAITAVLGTALATSTANAQFQIGVDVGSTFGSVPLVGTPRYYVSPYDSYYSSPSYYTPSTSYYYTPGYSTGYSYYSTPSYYYSSPGISTGIGNGVYGGWNRGYYDGGWNRGWGYNRGWGGRRWR